MRVCVWWEVWPLALSQTLLWLKFPERNHLSCGCHEADLLRSAQISRHGNLPQGPWVPTRTGLQLPHLWVHLYDHVRSGFWGCSQRMPEHNREYCSQVSQMPLLDNCGPETPRRSQIRLAGTSSALCCSPSLLLPSPSLPPSFLRPADNCREDVEVPSP